RPIGEVALRELASRRVQDLLERRAALLQPPAKRARAHREPGRDGLERRYAAAKLLRQDAAHAVLEALRFRPEARQELGSVSLEIGGQDRIGFGKGLIQERPVDGDLVAWRGPLDGASEEALVGADVTRARVPETDEFRTVREPNADAAALDHVGSERF